MDIRELPLEPAHAFVLSRVDGRTTVNEISSATGLPLGDVESALRRLAKLGAVDYAGLPNTSERTATRSEQGGDEAPAGAKRTGADPTQAKLELRATVDDLHSRFRDLTHYQLLGVPSQASRAAIRKAYYELVALLHPDRHSGKSIRDVRGKMEELVGQITKSYEVLKHKDRRADYDEQLQASRALRPSATSAKRPSPDELRDAARQRLKRGFSSNKSANPNGSPGAGTDSTSEARERAADGLKRLSVDRVTATEALAERLKTSAEAALRDGDVLSATNAMKARASLQPDNQQLAKELADFEEEGFKQTVEQHLQQARAAERSGDRETAALAFERAARGRPSDGELWGDALENWLDADGEPRHLVKLGQRAVLASPDKAKLHVLLARAYQRAAMPARAQGEISRAVKLSSSSATVKAWVKRIKRGES